MSQIRRPYDNEIGDAIRDYVAAQCGPGGPLDLNVQVAGSGVLVSANRGSQYNLQPDQSFTGRLPAVRVFLVAIDGAHNKPRGSWEGKYTYLIHYLRSMAAGEDAEKVTRPVANLLAQLFMQPDWSLPGFLAAGCMLRWCSATRIQVEETGPLQEMETNVGHGFVTVQVQADSFLYTPS